MLQKIQNLILLLERMQVLYGRVIELLDREREALISFDFNLILTLLREKDEILSVIKALDQDRLRIQDQFAIIMNRKADDISLRVLIDELKEQVPLEAKRLSQLRNDLALVISLVTRKVESNKEFIEASVDNLRQIASHLSEAIRGVREPVKAREQSQVYTGKGKVKDSKSVGGSLMEKRL
ncbi:MAG: flagellar export chaperone FlgN [Proteobacteria bacterium]|nr:flagellar export chaperone FlgN [Pseudomonadota bacterium]